MRTKQELLLGKQAVASGLISREQLKLCLHLQKQDEIPLPLILLKQKFIDGEDLYRLLEDHFEKIRQNESVDKGEDLVLCRLLLRSELLSPAALLRIVMQRRSSRYAASLSLAEVILEDGRVPVAELTGIYCNLSKELSHCPGCGKEFRLVYLAPGKKNALQALSQCFQYSDRGAGNRRLRR